jgi:hypothetical protein
MSLVSTRLMPHSKPVWTSRTSSLKRRRDSIRSVATDAEHNDVKVALQVTRLDVRGDAGEVELAGVYVFPDPGTRRTREDSVSLHSTVRRDARGGWHIESVR